MITKPMCYVIDTVGERQTLPMNTIGNGLWRSPTFWPVTIDGEAVEVFIEHHAPFVEAYCDVSGCSACEHIMLEKQAPGTFSDDSAEKELERRGWYVTTFNQNCDVCQESAMDEEYRG